MSTKILIIDDDNTFRNKLITDCRGTACSFAIADSIPRARALMTFENFDIILANVHVPGGESLELKQEMSHLAPHSQFIFMSSIDNHYNAIVDRGERCLHKYELSEDSSILFSYA